MYKRHVAEHWKTVWLRLNVLCPMIFSFLGYSEWHVSNQLTFGKMLSQKKILYFWADDTSNVVVIKEHFTFFHYLTNSNWDDDSHA